LLGETQVCQRVEQQAADQEFDREIIDALLLQPSRLSKRRHPGIDDAVAHREGGRLVPIVIGRRLLTLS